MKVQREQVKLQINKFTTFKIQEARETEVEKEELLL